MGSRRLQSAKVWIQGCSGPAPRWFTATRSQERRAALLQQNTVGQSAIADLVTIVDGVIFNVLEHCCYLRLVDGAVAELMKREFFWPGDVGFDENVIVIGRNLTVKIIGRKQGKRILTASLRQLTENPNKIEDVSSAEWIQIQESHPDGTIVIGKIDKILLGGASIILTDGALGFLPIKELSWLKEVNPSELGLLCDQLLTLKVIGIKENKKNLVLSYRQCITHPMDDPGLCPVVGRTYEGVVSNILDYGIFVQLPVGLDGLLHTSVLPEGFKSEVGQTIIVNVTSVDVEKRRIALAFPSGSGQTNSRFLHR